MRPSLKQRPSRRAGFTLIELMVAIVIIAILIGMLVPAIMGARRTALVRQVATEISRLEGGLADFKATFGVDPPSRITLHGSLSGSASDPGGWNGDARSKTIIRRLWPNFDFNGNGNAGQGDGAGGTFIGDKAVTLDGAECLVFFLGGVRDTDGAYIGFSNNPAQPFSLTGNSRKGPFFEFNLSRLADGDSDGLPEYLDTLSGQSSPYLYFSSYDGRGYDCADWALIPVPVPGLTDVYRSTAGDTDANRNCMFDAGDVDKNGNGKLDFGAAYNSKTFQIISPGFDGEYGTFGVYDSDSADTTLINNGTTNREPERDNITNFKGGVLAN